MNDCGHFDLGTIAERFREIETREKMAALARFLHELTILARDTYEPTTVGVSDPARLRGINEIMHRTTSRLVNLACGRPDDWSEPDFWAALAEISQACGTFGDLTAAAAVAVREILT